MAANIESMFFARTASWHGLGTKVEKALSSKEVLSLSGFDWNMIQKPMYTVDQELVPGYKANIRDFEYKLLGIVSERYKVVQNGEAFAFTNELLGNNRIRYETAGSPQGGKKELGKEYEVIIHKTDIINSPNEISLCMRKKGQQIGASVCLGKLYQEYLDLVMIFCLLVKKEVNFIGSVTVTNKIMAAWNVSLEELLRDALENGPRLLSEKITPMSDVLSQLAGGVFLPDDFQKEVQCTF